MLNKLSNSALKMLVERCLALGKRGDKEPSILIKYSKEKFDDNMILFKEDLGRLLLTCEVLEVKLLVRMSSRKEADRGTYSFWVVYLFKKDVVKDEARISETNSFTPS